VEVSYISGSLGIERKSGMFEFEAGIFVMKFQEKFPGLKTI
jgi:hypothetical protein